MRQDAIACVEMAIAMQRRMRELQSEWRDAGLEPVPDAGRHQHRLLHRGQLRQRGRMDYTRHRWRDLASRLQSHAGPGGILLSHETYSLVKDTVRAEEQAPIEVKGFTKPVRNCNISDPVDYSAKERSLIRAEGDGLRVYLDLQKLGRPAAAKALEDILNS